MGEFAIRGYNVALPEIDKGDDVYVLNEITGKLDRVQVKAATPQTRDGCYQVVILDSQINTNPSPGMPELHFIFALRHQEQWRFVIVSRINLKKIIDDRARIDKDFGSLNRKSRRRTLTLNISRKDESKVTCSQEPWTMDDWSCWPYLDHEQHARPEDYAVDAVQGN